MLPRLYRRQLYNHRQRRAFRTVCASGAGRRVGARPISGKPTNHAGVLCRLRKIADQEQPMSDGTQQPGPPGAPAAPPANAAEARSRLDALIADKDRGAKLLAGDAEVNREYRELRLKADNHDPADQVAVALSGNIGEMPDSTVKMLAETAGMLRDDEICHRSG